MKQGELINEGSKRLFDCDVPDYRTDAELLWQYVSGKDMAHMILDADMEADYDLADRYMALIEKRCTRYPLQYITGTQNFMGYDFATSENVLIPRQDTETLVCQALDILAQMRQKVVPGQVIRVLDLCCGTGCIGLSIKLAHPDIELTLADISDAAIDLAGQNADTYHIDCNIIQSDLFQNIDYGYDMIVSNPPYIRSAVIDGLMPEVRDFEPRLALDGADDGLLYYRKIIKEAGEFLKNGGYLLFEIGNDQASEVLQLLVDAHFTAYGCIRDLSGNDRVVIAGL